MGRDARQDGRGIAGKRIPEEASRGLETSVRTPSEDPREGAGRVPAVGKRNLDDVRGDVRDATRTKERRKSTVAQKAARDRSGNTKTHARASARVQNQPRTPGQRRPPGPGRARGAARAARARVPKPSRKALPVRKDDFERLDLRDEGGRQRTIERSTLTGRQLPTRELPDSSTRTAVDTPHVYHVDRAQSDVLRAVRSGTAENGAN